MGSTTVLVLGLDPTTVPGYDPAPVLAALDRGQRRFEERSISCHLGLVPLDERGPDQIAELLVRDSYECVVIGRGIRHADLEFFEVAVNLVRRHAPQAAIAFNDGPDDSADAAARWLTSS